MKRRIKKMISLVMVFCLIAAPTLGVAASETEEYLSELRLVYAATKAKAQEQMDEEYPEEEYEILDYNLNKKTGKQGVWLAYQTSTNIEDAITDLAVMPMQGGYEEGNYQEMIAQSRSEYEEMAKVYADAIDYFVKAYDAGDFLAESAYRQLNFYCDEEDHGGELLGDLMLSGMDPINLATIFMQGNAYALNNIRALIAMGVSYNEDGTSYLEQAAKNAAMMDVDGPGIFEIYDDFSDYDTYAAVIGDTITGFGTMFEELETVEDELNYEDEEITDNEVKYISNKAIAQMTRDVAYLGEQTLYEFCKSYEYDEEDLTALYPLVAALNEGQKPMVLLGHYFDVIRYSMATMPEEEMEAEITAQEELYKEYPFDIYTGVDRSIYTGSFALTSEAYRGDASSETGGISALFNSDTIALRILDIGAGAVSIGSFAWAITRSVKSAKHYKTWIANKTNDMQTNLFWSSKLYDKYPNWGAYVDDMINEYDVVVPANATFSEKVSALDTGISKLSVGLSKTDAEYYELFRYEWDSSIASNETWYRTTYPKGYYGSGVTNALYAIGGITLVYSAISLGISVYNYYHPEYDDIPAAMVDLIATEDGDRYIKYEAVREGANEDAVGDLNAFSAERWNALYYTKSYEAGKPLLAEFNVSTNDNKAAEGYLPVHKFGEITCFNLNKFNFDSDSETIYLSAAQSDNQKSAVEDVPEVIGSMVTTGYYVLAACTGLAAGIVATVGFQAFKKRKMQKNKHLG